MPNQTGLGHQPLSPQNILCGCFSRSPLSAQYSVSPISPRTYGGQTAYISHIGVFSLLRKACLRRGI